jgi:hypothetical protein
MIPHLRSFARRAHVNGRHYMGELLSPRHAQIWNDHCPFGKRTTGFLDELRRSFKECGSHLRPGCLLPPGWEFPDWEAENIWIVELIKIKMEDERFNAAKKRCEAESQRRKKKGL